MTPTQSLPVDKIAEIRKLLHEQLEWTDSEDKLYTAVSLGRAHAEALLALLTPDAVPTTCGHTGHEPCAVLHNGQMCSYGGKSALYADITDWANHCCSIIECPHRSKNTPESDLARLARPPAPIGNGEASTCAVGVQPVARISSTSKATAVSREDLAEAQKTLNAYDDAMKSQEKNMSDMKLIVMANYGDLCAAHLRTILKLIGRSGEEAVSRDQWRLVYDAGRKGTSFEQAVLDALKHPPAEA